MNPFDVVMADEPGTASPPFYPDCDGGLNTEVIEVFERYGVVSVKNAIAESETEALRAALNHAIHEASELGYQVNDPGGSGFFFTDHNLWQRFDTVKDVAINDQISAIAGSLMRSKTVALYVDNVFVKEKGIIA